MGQTEPKRSWVFKGGGVVLAACLLAWLGDLTGLVSGYDRSIYDLFHNLAGERCQPEHVQLVMIDDASLAAHLDEPMVFWGPHYARAMQVLRQAGASEVGLDIRFMVSAESWLKRLGVTYDHQSRTFDGAFREQLGAGGVVLVASMGEASQAGVSLIMPIPDYLFSLPGAHRRVGLDALYPDDDGVVRQFVPAWLPGGDPPNLSLAMLLAALGTGQDPTATDWTFGTTSVPNASEPIPIRFCGPPGTHRPLSFQTLLEPDALDRPEVRAVAGRVVVLGAGFSSAQDVHSTPYASGLLGSPGRLMSGPEIHANIIETLLSGRLPKRVPTWVAWIVALAAALIGTAMSFRLGPAQAALAIVGLAAVFGLAAYLLFLGDLLVEVGPAHLALGGAYLGALGLRLTGEERKRREIRQMFGQYVSDEVVERLVASGSPDLGGVEAQVSVLFSDIRNFTTISEKLAAAEVVELINTYFSRATDAILAEGGTIDKFIGDAIMAVFGSPVAHADHARRALRAAVKLSQIADDFRTWVETRFADRGLPAFDVGIGIHTGEAVVGNIGSTRRMEFTAIGDTVNTASRLEGVTKTVPYRIIISAVTQAAAGEGLNVGPRDSVQVKGRRAPIEVVAFLGFEGESPAGGTAHAADEDVEP